MAGIFDSGIFDTGIFDHLAASGITITVGSTNVTNSVPLETIRLEETLDNRGTFSFTIEDITNSISVAARDDVTITDSGSTVFRGVVLSRKYTQHVGFRLIEVSGSDYSIVLDERVVGAPAGSVFVGPDAQGNYTADDPNANTTATDKTTVQHLFAAYVSNPTIDTSTYVNEYISNGYLGSHPIYWRAVTLRSALQDLAAVAGPDVHFWVDATRAFHWQTFPLSPTGGTVTTNGPVVLLFPEDPTLTSTTVGIAESALVDNTTLYGVQDPPGITINYDGASMPQAVYLTGTTDFVYTPTGTVKVTLPVGNGVTQTLIQSVPVVQGGGTGWYPYNDAQGTTSQNSSVRQAIVSSDAATVAERTADGLSATRYASREIIRGQATVISTNLIFHVGQSLQVRFPTALGVDGYFPLQRVTTQYLSGDGKRRHELEFGDASVGRLTQRRPAKATVEDRHAKLSATYVEIGETDASPAPGTVMTLPVNVRAPDGLTVSSQFPQTVQFQLFYFRAPDYSTPVADASPYASISPTSMQFGSSQIGQYGQGYVTVTFTSSAAVGDKAMVAAYMQDNA